MTAHWLLKTEPSTYSFDQLERDGRATWDGVRNPAALNHLRAMQKGDEALIYHTGDEKAVIGIARVTKGGYPDPAAGDPKLVVVDLVPVTQLGTPVSLSAIKKDSRFADMALVRISRLSVMPVSAAHWKQILDMGKGK